MTQVNENLKIEIRPIPGANGIREFSEKLEYFSQAHTLPPLVNPTSMQYEVGLTKEDLKYLESKNCPYDLNPTYVPGVPHKFWESPLVKIDLLPTPMFLYPGKNILDFIKWKFLQKSNFIYQSENEIESSSKPQATHYIYNNEIENEAKATKIEKRYELTSKISNLSTQRKRSLIMLILEESVENKKDSYLTIKFEEILSDKDKTIELEELLKEPVKTINLKAEIKSAIFKNVLRKNKQGVFFQELNLGFSESEVYDFLSKDENQEILINIKQKL